MPPIIVDEPPAEGGVYYGGDDGENIYAYDPNSGQYRLVRMTKRQQAEYMRRYAQYYGAQQSTRRPQTRTQYQPQRRVATTLQPRNSRRRFSN